MYIQNRKIALAYKLAATAVCLWGQVMASGIWAGTFNTETYYYYTQQSNVLCLVYFILSAAHCAQTLRRLGPRGPASFAPRFKGAVVIAITVTMLIYWALLHRPGRPAAYMVESVLTHLAVPLLTIADWALFDPKGAYKKYDPVLWLCIPLIYWLFAFAMAQAGKTYYSGRRYPYFFIDPDQVGPAGVAGYVPALAAVFLAIGYAIYAADWFMGKRARKAEA